MSVRMPAVPGAYVQQAFDGAVCAGKCGTWCPCNGTGQNDRNCIWGFHTEKFVLTLCFYAVFGILFLVISRLSWYIVHCLEHPVRRECQHVSSVVYSPSFFSSFFLEDFSGGKNLKKQMPTEPDLILLSKAHSSLKCEK